MKQLNLILGVTGSIAAYKAPELVRRLREKGVAVQVVMTASAGEFITRTTLQAVSGLPVRSSLWDEDAEAAMGHIELARWADIVLVAPATAEFLSRLATGSAADLLTTLCLATEAPLAAAPAMNRVMWASRPVQDNRRTLADRGVRLLGPGSGDQACGELGEGRMLQPEEIVQAVMAMRRELGSDADAPLAGKTVLITAGPTREAIDPVRFISNHSSGKMGYALAEAAADAGARVILISGPVSLAAPVGVERHSVESAEEMFAETHQRIDDADIFIGAAAVSDYRPTTAKEHKIKKNEAELHIDLVRSPDTLASVANLSEGPFTVGFAAETQKLKEYALAKLKDKKLDMIVANQVGPDCGFNCPDNAVEVYWHRGERSIPLMDKQELARELIALIGEQYAAAGDATVPELPAMARQD